MNWDAIGAIGEFLGALVVVGSIFYLSRQIRESNKHARGEVERHIQHTWNQYLSANSTDADSRDAIRRGYGSFNSLSDSEKTVFLNWISQVTGHLEMILRMEIDGLVAKETADTYRSAIVGLIATPGGREFWEISNGVYSPLSAKYISEKLNDPSTLALSDIFPFLIEEKNANT